MKFRVVKCVSCAIYQVRQQTRTGKYTCVVCNTKQTILNIYYESESAKDCREVCQNLSSKQAEMETLNSERIVMRNESDGDGVGVVEKQKREKEKSTQQSNFESKVEMNTRDRKRKLFSSYKNDDDNDNSDGGNDVKIGHYENMVFTKQEFTKTLNKSGATVATQATRERGRDRNESNESSDVTEKNDVRTLYTPRQRKKPTATESLISSPTLKFDSNPGIKSMRRFTVEKSFMVGKGEYDSNVESLQNNVENHENHQFSDDGDDTDILPIRSKPAPIQKPIPNSQPFSYLNSKPTTAITNQPTKKPSKWSHFVSDEDDE
ncbi:hypothetical protein HK098_000728 [Nowakowskiella sp. JEL0407]|nr:hypothetical protein HK098_000728 [Nowakowskiella sp. JEL0407]